MLLVGTNPSSGAMLATMSALVLRLMVMMCAFRCVRKGAGPALVGVRTGPAAGAG